MVRTWSGLAVLGLLCCVGYHSGSAEPPSKGPDRLSVAEKKLIELTNQIRMKHNLSPLRFNAILSRVARAHSANMARKGKMEHVLDGKEVSDRLDAVGYPWMEAGENLATMRPDDTLEEVLKAWLKSKGHRENLLNPDYTETGIGLARDKKGVTFITQVFAAPQKPKQK